MYGSKKALLAGGHDEETRCGEARRLAAADDGAPPLAPILVSKWTGPVSDKSLSLVAGDI